MFRFEFPENSTQGFVFRVPPILTMEVDAGAAPAAPAGAIPPGVVRTIGNQYEEAVSMVNAEWINDGWRIHSFNSMKVGQNWCACINWIARNSDGSTAWFNHEIWRVATPTIWPTGIKYELGRPHHVIFTWYRPPVRGEGVRLPPDNTASGGRGSDDTTDHGGANPASSPSASAMDTGDDAGRVTPNVGVPPPPLPPSSTHGRTAERSPEKRRCIKQ